MAHKRSKAYEEARDWLMNPDNVDPNYFSNDPGVHEPWTDEEEFELLRATNTDIKQLADPEFAKRYVEYLKTHPEPNFPENR